MRASPEGEAGGRSPGGAVAPGTGAHPDPGRPSWPLGMATRVAALMILAFWMWVWRVPIWSHDDLGFANRSGRPRGGLVWSMLPHQAWDDLMARNGRLADMVVQVIMSTQGFVGPLVALVCAAQTWALWFLLGEVARQSRPVAIGRGCAALVLVTGMAVPFTLLGLDTSLAGTTVMFLSATVGYVGGAALVCTTLVLMWRLRGSSSWLRGLLTTLLAIYSGLHHELLAMMLVGGALALLAVTERARRTASMVVALVIIIIASLARYGVGGLWARQARVGPPFSHEELSFVPRSLAYATHSLSMILGAHGSVLGLAVGAVALLGLVARRSGVRRMGPLVVALLGVAVLVCVLGASIRLGTIHEGTVHRSYASYTGTVPVLLLVGFVTVVILVIAICWQSRHLPGGAIATLVLGATLGALAVPMALGSPGGRTLYLAMFMLLVLTASCAMVALGAVAGAQPPSLTGWAALLILAGVTGPGLHAAPALVSAVDASIRSWQPTLAQIEEVRRGRCTQVTVPATLPQQLYSSDYFVLRTRHYQKRLVLYYGLPESTRVTRR